MSTIVFNNLGIVLALYLTLRGKTFFAMSALSFASYLTVYPIMLLVPLIFLSPKRDARTTIAHFLEWLSVFVGASYWMMGNWDFVWVTYGFAYLVEDLDPNIGLFWYFYTEMFDHFRPLFTFTLQYHPFIYLAPLAIRIRHHPMFFFWIIVAIIATFKAYPAAGDVVLYVALIPFIFHQIKGMTYGFVVLGTMLFVSVLTPIFWTMWIHYGTGNSNFYYAINLVFAMAQILFISDSLSTVLQQDFLRKNNIILPEK